MRILAGEKSPSVTKIPIGGTLSSLVCRWGPPADNFCHASSTAPHGHHVLCLAHSRRCWPARPGNCMRASRTTSRYWCAARDRQSTFLSRQPHDSSRLCHVSSTTPHGTTLHPMTRAPQGCWPARPGTTYPRTHCCTPDIAPHTAAGLRKMSPAPHQQHCGDLTESLVTIFVTPRSGSMHVQRSTCVVKKHPHRSRAFECVPLQDCCLPDRPADPARHQEGIGTHVLCR